MGDLRILKADPTGWSFYRDIPLEPGDTGRFKLGDVGIYYYHGHEKAGGAHTLTLNNFSTGRKVHLPANGGENDQVFGVVTDTAIYRLLHRRNKEF